MRNVLKIIISDIKRLSVNVVAMVVIIGLTVIPCLYAWFNILSNWDPYGEDATSNLQVAVASSDEGISIGGLELNVGDIIISNLKENNTIGWVFTDTEAEAINGVYSGDYYAALVIDERFSADMISFLSSDLENPVITYYENEKKNAIAPKITSKVKTTIEREVDHAFVSTVAQALLTGSEYFASVDEESDITGKGIAKLKQLDSDMKGLILILESYVALVDSTESISKAGEAISDSAKNITDLAESMAEDSKDSLSSAHTDIQKAKDSVDGRVNSLNNNLDSVDSSISAINSMLSSASYGGAANMDELMEAVKKLQAAWGTKDDGVNYYYLLYNFDTGSDEGNDALKARADELNTAITGLDQDVENLSRALSESEENFEEAKKTTTANVAAILSGTKSVREGFTGTVSPLAQSAIDSAANSVTEIEKLLDYNATSIDLVMDNLDSYSDLMDQSKDSLAKALDEAVSMERRLSALISDIEGVSDNEAYQKFMELLESDPELLSDFISSPVEISDEYVYAVENNGSMTAPFYIVLSIWVGSLIMSTILKTTVKDADELPNVKNWQCFLGRYFTTFVIGQIQTVITVLGAFLFVGIQCLHPFYFWLACAWTSLIYSLLLYSFTYSFGNVGEALSVILMVIQVAGAGGTFPIEVLPKVFQILYKFMPFNYSMNALRECVGGFYEDTYRNCMLSLVGYGIAAVFIGVVLYHPFKILNDMIEKSKEKSGILI